MHLPFPLTSHTHTHPSPTEWVGINALLYYGPTLVASIGLQGEEMTLLVSGGIGVAQFVAVLPAIAYIDRWGEWVGFFLRW